MILWDYESIWPDVWPQNKCRSLWSIFQGPVILPYILKSIWCMNIMLCDYESVWHNIWPKNKWRALWPTFHGPVILPYISWSSDFALYLSWRLIDIWTPYFWIKSQYNPNVWPQNICSTLWPIFRGPVILPYILKTIHWLNIMSQYDLTSDLKIFVGHYNLYFMVHWICLISWNCLMYEHHTLELWVSMTNIWLENKCRSLWPIFHGLVILPYILSSSWWMNVILLENESV